MSADAGEPLVRPLLPFADPWELRTRPFGYDGSTGNPPASKAAGAYAQTLCDCVCRQLVADSASMRVGGSRRRCDSLRACVCAVRRCSWGMHAAA